MLIFGLRLIKKPEALTKNMILIYMLIIVDL